MKMFNVLFSLLADHTSSSQKIHKTRNSNKRINVSKRVTLSVTSALLQKSSRTTVLMLPRCLWTLTLTLT